MAITCIVGYRGAGNLTSNACARDTGGKARDHEISGEDRTLDRLSLEKKADLVYNMINFNAIADCLAVYRFLNRDLLVWNDYREILYLLTGMEKIEESLKEIADNSITLGRLRNIECGLTLQDDLLHQRLYNEPIGDTTPVSKDQYLVQLGKYYELRGWDVQGVPRKRPDITGYEAERRP